MGFPVGVLVLLAQAAVLCGILPEIRFAYTASVAYFLFLSALAFSFSLIVGYRAGRVWNGNPPEK